MFRLARFFLFVLFYSDGFGWKTHKYLWIPRIIYAHSGLHCMPVFFFLLGKTFKSFKLLPTTEKRGKQYYIHENSSRTLYEFQGFFEKEQKYNIYNDSSSSKYIVKRFLQGRININYFRISSYIHVCIRCHFDSNTYKTNTEIHLIFHTIVLSIKY